MLEKSQRDLRRSIRRKLAVRLLLVCLPLAVAASLAVYLLERDRFGDDVLSWTFNQAALFNAEQGGVLDRLDRLEVGALERALATREGNWVGSTRSPSSGTPGIWWADRSATRSSPPRLRTGCSLRPGSRPSSSRGARAGGTRARRICWCRRR
jgi:hypothetical protein